MLSSANQSRSYIYSKNILLIASMKSLCNPFISLVPYCFCQSSNNLNFVSYSGFSVLGSEKVPGATRRYTSRISFQNRSLWTDQPSLSSSSVSSLFDKLWILNERQIHTSTTFTLSFDVNEGGRIICVLYFFLLGNQDVARSLLEEEDEEEVDAGNLKICVFDWRGQWILSKHKSHIAWTIL